MWHEARRQEKKIRGLMVDYKKRAERRRQYYERIVSEITMEIFSVNTNKMMEMKLYHNSLISFIFFLISPYFLIRDSSPVPTIANL